MFILDINAKYDVIEAQGKVIFPQKMRNIKSKNYRDDQCLYIQTFVQK